MQNIQSLPQLYKRDSKGKIRVWSMQAGWDDEDTAGIRAISGLEDGKKIVSVWNISKPTNVGRANARNALEQAKFEAKAEWTKQTEKGYFDNIHDVDSFTAFKPMLAHDFTKTPVTSGICQPKLDGIRCIASAKGLFSRAFKEIVAVPHISEALADFVVKHPTVTLDGELYNHELKADFQKITSLVRKTKNISKEALAESKAMVQYHVYDMFDSANPEMTFMQRYNWLQANLKQADTGPSIVKVVTHIAETPEDIDMLYGKYTEQGYEGQMIRQNTPYEGKRTKNLLKRKEFITEEYKVVKVIEGQGAWSGYAKRFILALPDGTEFGSGVRGNQAQLKELLESNNTPDWATCRYFELSNDGVPRFPVVIDYGTGVRND